MGQQRLTVKSHTFRTRWKSLLGFDRRCVLQMDDKRLRRVEGKAVRIARVTFAVPQPHHDLRICRQ